MSLNPILDAFESVDVTPSAAFRQRARGEFLSALGRHEAGDEIATDVTATVIEASRPTRRRRISVVFGIAASVAVVAALTVVVLNRRSGPSLVDTSHDSAIAGSALISPKQVGVSWQITHQWDAFTSRKIAEVAASVPACADYVDFAFDSPRRKAVTAGRIFASAPLFALTQWVYIFPTEAAATQAMDKIAEGPFVPCLSQFMDALFPKLGSSATTTTIDALPLATHGDRQVVLGQSIHVDGGGTYTVMNAFVQVGRGIVYVNPTPDSSHDSLDPAGRLEKVFTAATDNLTNALDSAGP